MPRRSILSAAERASLLSPPDTEDGASSKLGAIQSDLKEIADDLS